MGTKKGHLTKLERRIVATLAFRRDMSQEDREASYELLERLDMRDELFRMATVGSLPDLVRPPKLPPLPAEDASEAQSAAALEKRHEAVIAHNEHAGRIHAALDSEIVPFVLRDEDIDHLLKVLAGASDLHTLGQVTTARVGKRLREIKSGTYAPPIAPSDDATVPQG